MPKRGEAIKPQSSLRGRRQEAPADLVEVMKHLIFPIQILPNDQVLIHIAVKLSEHYDVYAKDRSLLRGKLGDAKRFAAQEKMAEKL